MADIRITQINTYPIKSCGALSHDTMDLDPRGLRYDRRWMVVHDTDKERGRFITQREYPRLALVQPSFVDNGTQLALTAPNMSEICVPTEMTEGEAWDVVVWRSNCKAWDAGREAAAWFSDYLGTPLRLVWMLEDFVRPVDPNYAITPAQVGFADAYPLLVISEASLSALNDRLIERGKDAIPMSRFRTNLVVAGCEPFAEDTWKSVMIGDVPFDVVKPCARCETTTVDQQTGDIPDYQEPLATLATFRRVDGKVMFGQNIIHRGMGTLKVGQSVSVITTKD